MSTELITKAVVLLEPIILLVLTWLAAVAANWIRTTIKNEHLRALLLRLDDAVYTAVCEAEQTLVAEMKAAADDGEIDAAEAREIRDKTLARARAYLGPKGIAELKRVIGADALATMLEAKLEATVHEQRKGAGFAVGTLKETE